MSVTQDHANAIQALRDAVQCWRDGEVSADSVAKLAEQWVTASDAQIAEYTAFVNAEQAKEREARVALEPLPTLATLDTSIQPPERGSPLALTADGRWRYLPPIAATTARYKTGGVWFHRLRFKMSALKINGPAVLGILQFYGAADCRPIADERFAEAYWWTMRGV